jgi:hypothetical protein
MNMTKQCILYNFYAPPCSSGMAEKESLQKKWISGKFWMAQGVGHRQNEDDTPCKSGMGQGNFRQARLGQKQGRTRNQETTKGREETAENSRVQQWPKERIIESAAMRPRHM